MQLDTAETLKEDPAQSRAILALAAATVIGVGVRLPAFTAVALIVVGCALLIYAVVLKRSPVTVLPKGALFRYVSVASLAIGVALFTSWTVRFLLPSSSTNWLIVAPGILVVVTLAASVFAFPNVAHRLYPVFLIAFLGLQIVAIAATWGIDVTYYQTEGAKALLGGSNPFATMLPDLFSGSGLGEPVFGPGVSVDGILQFGFPYPPFSLALIVPFQALFQEYRIGIAVAYVITAWMISRLGEPEISRRVSILSLLVAPVTIANTAGFTEPLVILLGVAVMLVHKRRPQLSPYVLGGFLAIKQYTFIALPIFLLLEPRPWRLRQAIRAAAIATAVVVMTTLPFLVWNSEALIRSVYLLQLKQPLRGDAITFTAQYLAPYLGLSNLALAALPLGAALIGIALSLKYAPTGLQGYALGSALTFLMFFLFAKQASMPNYYVVVIAYCFAAAAMFISPPHRFDRETENASLVPSAEAAD